MRHVIGSLCSYLGLYRYVNFTVLSLYGSCGWFVVLFPHFVVVLSCNFEFLHNQCHLFTFISSCLLIVVSLCCIFAFSGASLCTHTHLNSVRQRWFWLLTNDLTSLDGCYPPCDAISGFCPSALLWTHVIQFQPLQMSQVLSISPLIRCLITLLLTSVNPHQREPSPPIMFRISGPTGAWWKKLCLPALCYQAVGCSWKNRLRAPADF